MEIITDTAVGQAAEWFVTSTGCQAVRSAHRRPRTREDLLAIDLSWRYIGQVVLTAADGDRQRIVQCEHRHHSASRAETCARQLALRLGLPKGQVCRQCQAVLSGYLRGDARRRGWEPWSTTDPSHGPLVCRDCVAQLLDDTIAALRTVAVG
jgi:hypothetical protein